MVTSETASFAQIEFRVSVLGTPKPNVQWYKDDAEIFACERIEIKEEAEGGAIVVKVRKTQHCQYILNFAVWSAQKYVKLIFNNYFRILIHLQAK